MGYQRMIYKAGAYALLTLGVVVFLVTALSINVRKSTCEEPRACLIRLEEMCRDSEGSAELRSFSFNASSCDCSGECAGAMTAVVVVTPEN